ncbi:MAG: TerB N-terminal domain-containing protein [Methanoregula sp.]|nr:TerB N-terminal domain-containing protein [Methanoregula sp.]
MVNQSKNYTIAVTQSPIFGESYQNNRGRNLNWAGFGKSITVQGYTIENPLTYWSDGISSPEEASCIDRKLPIEKTGTDSQTLPYYPQYSDLTPGQRGKYLSWLSRGRNDNLDEIGYAFIYFYGLERRGIIEKEETEKLLEEVRRLLVRYPNSISFNYLLNNFIAYIVGSRLNEMEEPAIFKYFPSLDNLERSSTNVILSWYWEKNKPISWELGYSLSKYSRDSPKSNVMKKNPEILKRLFKERFQTHFPQGIPIDPDYTQFQMDYRPASSSLLSYYGYSKETNQIGTLTLSIPQLSSDYFKTLYKIWAECLEELKPLTNKLEKTGGTVTREVYSLIPSELKVGMIHPDMELWQQYLSSKTPVNGLNIAKISELAGFLGIEERNSLTATQSRMISTTAEENGFVIVPDPTISGNSYKWNDAVAIIPIGDKEKPVSENFQRAALIFEMAHGIAASDENVSPEEEDLLYQFFTERFALNPSEINCLKGLQLVLEIQPPSLSTIGKRLSKHLDPEQKIALANFLGEIVLIDNKFVKEEQKAIKTVFKALEIDPAVSDELIKKFLVGHIPDEPITVLKSGRTRKGEAIPPPAITPEFSMSKEKLKQTMDDTRAVQDILASVFEQELEEIVVDIEPEVKIPESPVSTYTKPNGFNLPFPSETIPTLDTKYLSMLYDIMKSNEMSQDDFTNLARKHNLMPRAAFDDINSWADEELGDFLLEESESRILINYKKRSIVGEWSGLWEN